LLSRLIYQKKYPEKNRYFWLFWSLPPWRRGWVSVARNSGKYCPIAHGFTAV